MTMDAPVDVEPSEVLKAMEVLCLSRGCTQNEEGTIESEAPSPSTHQQFLQKLRNNLSNLDQFLMSSKPVQAVLQHPHTALDHCHLQTPSQDVQWRFVVTSIHLLRSLKIALETSVRRYTVSEQEQFSAMNPKQVAVAQMDSSAPGMSPDTLSHHQQKVLLSCLQMVVCLGVLPSLRPGVGVPLRLRSSFSALLLQAQENPDDVGDDMAVHRDFRLVFCVKHLLALMQEPTIGSFILSKHLSDLLAGLCQIVFAPRTKQLKALIKAQEIVVVRMDKVKLTHSDIVKPEYESCNHGAPPVTVSSDSVAQRAGTATGDLPASEPITDCDLTAQCTETLQESPLQPAAGLSIEVLKEDEVFCNQQLSGLMTRLHQPMLVRELVLLQGLGGVGFSEQGTAHAQAPAWLRRASIRLLAEIIIKPDGVKNILRGMLQDPQEIAGGFDFKASDTLDWRKCQAIAGMIAQVPYTQTAEQYYSRVGPQVLELLQCADVAPGRQCLQVAVSTIEAMLAQQPIFARQHVTDPLLQPILDCLSDKEIVRSEKAVILVDEYHLGRCIDNIHRVVLSGWAVPHLLQSTLRAILQPLFCLLCLARVTAVNLRAPAKEILVTVLRIAAHQVSLKILRQLAFYDVTPEEGEYVQRLHCDVMFTPGPSGGAVAITKPGKGEFILPAAEDMEVRCACVVELIKGINQANLTAGFFLSLLDNLTTVMSDRIASDGSKDATALRDRDVLMEIERRTARQEMDAHHSLVVLHLVGLLAEDVGPAFLTTPSHILDFAKITLERALWLLKATDDEMMGVFESETVTMAMGMLTALMGGAAELSRQDKDSMQVVLPLLNELADHHPDPQVSEMAADLRIAIATRGAVWSDILKGAQRFSCAKEKRQQVPEPEITTLHMPGDVPAPVPVVATRKGSGGIHEKSISSEDPSAPTRRGPLIEVISSTAIPPEVDLKQEPKVERQNRGGGKRTAGKSGSLTSHSVTGGRAGMGDSQVQTEIAAGKTVLPEAGATTTSDFREAVDELCSPLVPVRGHALISLRRLVERRDAETLERPDFLLKIFRENLDHTDSYLYLAAIGGLAALADQKPDFILPVLAAEYANQDAESTGTRKRSPEVRMKLGEVIVKTSRAFGPLVPQYRDVLLAAFLTGARDPDFMVRASAVSNMGDLCKLLRYSLGNIIHEVLECVTALIRHDPEPEVRKAAALHTTLLLQGVGKDAPKVLETTLRDVYRTLKLVLVSEKDPGVLLHVRLSLEELDTTMRALLFPPQTLTKRIRVLDAE